MSARPQERQTAQPVAAWAHTEDRGRGAGLLPRGRWGGPPLSCLEDLTLHLFPRSPNFTNNPSTCSLHLLRSQSAQAHPFPCSAFFQLLWTARTPRVPGRPTLPLQWARPASAQTQAPARSLCFAQKFPLGPPGSPRMRFQSRADRCPASSLLPGASCAGAVNGRRAHLGSPGAGRA